MKRIKLFMLLLCLNSITFQSKAQLSPADSTFLIPLFDEIIYNDDSVFPGDWYVNPLFTTLPGFYNLIDSNFRFQNSHYPNAYSGIQLQSFSYDTVLNQTFNYYFQNFQNAYQQNDPLVKIKFALNGIQSCAYSTFTNGNFDTTCNIAYLVIPGTGFNQTTDIMTGYGYYNTHCFLKEKLSQTGDVFVYCKPLEDYRAIRWNGNKLNSADYLTPGAPSWVYSHLLSINKAFGLNYIIECLALIKEMKTKYKKVVLVGCSLGGYSALLLSTLCTVDGCMLAAGWSVLFDITPGIQYELTRNFDSVGFYLNKNIIKANIDSNKATRYLFTYGNIDEPWFQAEHDSALTQTFLAASKNCFFDTAYNFHAIPPCPIIDSFIAKVLHFPKVRFDTISSSDTSCVAKVSICGTAPYTFELYRDSVYLNTYTINTDTMSVTLDTTGKYYLRNISNTFGDTTVCSDTVYFEYKFPAGLNIPLANSGIRIQNPFNDELLIHFNIRQQEIRIVIYDILGKIVYSVAYLQATEIKINTAILPKGIYILRILGDKVLYQEKINKL